MCLPTWDTINAGPQTLGQAMVRARSEPENQYPEERDDVHFASPLYQPGRSGGIVNPTV